VKCRTGDGRSAARQGHYPLTLPYGVRAQGLSEQFATQPDIQCIDSKQPQDSGSGGFED